MKLAVIDDEQFWRQNAKQKIEEYLDSMGESAEISSYSTGEEFLEQREAFDMLFMDVEMKDMNGFDAICAYKRYFPDCLAVVLTMYNEYSHIGYRVNAFRYIWKAKMEEQIEEALLSGMKMMGRNKKISLHVVNMGDIQLETKEILFIETEKRNVRIHTRKGNYLCNQTISELESQLKDCDFFLVHKSTLVSLDAIVQIDIKKRKIQLYDGSLVTVARQKIPELKEEYMQYVSELAGG